MIKEITPFIAFDGNCQDALDFYSKLFATDTIEKMTYADSDIEVSTESKSKIVYSAITIGTHKINMYDELEYTNHGGNAISIMLEMDTEANLRNIFKEIVINKGKVEIDVSEMFWNAYYAKVTDKFGVTWELNYQKE